MNGGYGPARARWCHPVLAAALVLSACGGGDDPSSAAATPLRATLEQSRAAQVRGLVNVVLSSESDRVVRISTLRLDDARFAEVEPTSRRVEVAADEARLLVPVAIGAARCDEATEAPAIELDGGRRVDIDRDGAALLDRLVEDACDREAIADVAHIDFDREDASAASPVLVDVTLRIERRADGGAVTVDAVGSNVIFAVTSSELPATLAPSEQVMDVTVRFSAERCEPHALAESKKTFLFPVWVALDGGEPQFVELEVLGAARRALDDALDACAGT